MDNPHQEISIPVGAKMVSHETENAGVSLEHLYDEYSESLFRFALALTKSSDDAEDAVQEVFVRIARNMRRFRRIRSVRAYLFSAVRNEAFSILRKRKRKGESESLLELASTNVNIDVKEELGVSQTILEAFSNLPIEQREVLILKIYDELTFREIGETVGASINTVIARYRYGIEKLRRALGGDLYGR